jgi:hypothetical protein
MGAGPTVSSPDPEAQSLPSSSCPRNPLRSERCYNGIRIRSVEADSSGLRRLKHLRLGSAQSAEESRGG